MSFKRTLPSINALVTLEAATRLRSFTAAARELNVTQAAVSRQIRMLEDEFGMPMFQRSHRRVEPSTAGEVLGSALYQALEIVRDGVEQVRRSRNVHTLTVGATLAFTYFWLLPRLPRFRERHPGLRIKVISADEPLNFRSGDIDVLMRYGVPPFADGRTVVSASDTYFPVCSPAMADGLGGSPTPRELMELPLLGSDGSDPKWMLWEDWFDHAGVGRRLPRPTLQFNHYTDCVAAALGGQGVALGWQSIVGDLVGKGQLVCLGEKVGAQASYNVVLPHRRTPNGAADEFVNWIASMFEETGTPLRFPDERASADADRHGS